MKNKKEKDTSIPTCDLCNKSFSKNHKYKEHMLKKHKVNLYVKTSVISQCPECDFKSAVPSRVKAHITLEHNSDKESYHCDLCNFICFSKSGFYRHTKNIHDLSVSLAALDS